MATATRITPEDLLKMPDEDCYELVEGQLVERNLSTKSSHVAGTVFGLLDAYNRPRKLGWLFPEGTGYQCFPDDPNKLRRPDASWIRLDRLSRADYEADGYLRTFPDLAVEVVSPGDGADDIKSKVEEFLHAGTRLVWVVYPRTREVDVHRCGGTGTILRDSDELDGEDVLPGIRCRVADLFQVPA